eukprot:GHRQ01024145.1.p1 GENE.GHRQ01024145.1~~GHRQ01024145.1.p1  ORF type:complete len:108 (+),score=2.79 GHRQ01024145.1:616-939(+)
MESGTHTVKRAGAQGLRAAQTYSLVCGLLQLSIRSLCGGFFVLAACLLSFSNTRATPHTCLVPLSHLLSRTSGTTVHVTLFVAVPCTAMHAGLLVDEHLRARCSSLF